VSGRVCVITGASSGIGKATAIGLARRGATLALVCRDPGRGGATVEEIRRTTGNDAVRVFVADLSSQQAIRSLAGELLAAYPALHVLVNNAGVVNLRRTTTVDGIETVLAVNHLAYYLLTRLLLEGLAASGRARVVNVASDAHRFVRTLELDDLGWARRRWRSMRVYGASKLANILFTYELARRLDGRDVTANCLHPGAVATGLGTNNGAIARLLAGALRPFFRTPDDGAATSIHLATSPEVEGVSGAYFADAKPARTSPASYDNELARRLWDVSAAMVGLAP
jgi:retinol dehydrogenase 12